METTFKDVACADIPFLLRDLHQGLFSAPTAWFTWDKLDAVLGLTEAVWVAERRWVGSRASEMGVEALRAMAKVDRLVGAAGDALYRGDPALAIGPLVGAVNEMTTIWNWMDEKGYTHECYNS